MDYKSEYYFSEVLRLILEKNEKVAIEKIKHSIEIQGVNNTGQLSEMNDYYEKNYIHY